ncbi:MAG: hypothetical protein IKT27_04690 [Clostridia bacterium]|nr:hypothetical protein [Clostridia bacterium]
MQSYEKRNIPDLITNLESPEIFHFVKNSKKVNYSGNLQERIDFCKYRDHVIKFIISSYYVLKDKIETQIERFDGNEQLELDERQNFLDEKSQKELEKQALLIAGVLENKDITKLDAFLLDSLVNIADDVEETERLVGFISKKNHIQYHQLLNLKAFSNRFIQTIEDFQGLRKLNQKFYIKLLEIQDLSL